MNSYTVLLVVIALIALVALVYYQRYAQQKRIEALQRAGAELGLFLSPEGDATLQSSLSGFHLFSQGHSRRLSGLIQGVARGVPVSIFDYRYVVSSGNKNNRSHEQTAICFELAGSALPAFALRPETVWSKMGAWLGGQDIDFDSVPDFSSRYVLQGTDEAAVRGLFADRVLAFYAARPGLCTEGGGDRLLFYRSDVLVKPEALSALMDEGLEVLALFQPRPEF